MIRRTVDLTPDARDGFDAIIDVRSPAEFAFDHIPGAINLPVLDDAQRAAVGTEYVQGSKFLARRTGAAMVARNIAAHLEGPLGGRGGGFRPLVYCWRGGQRSGAMVTVMDQVGWPVTVLDGGYQTWRRQVQAALYETPVRHRLILLDGPTGSGKTALLEAVAARGGQTLDLEALAAHRGSLFGAMPGGQPSQKAFETRLHDALSRLDPARPVLVEAESSKIGARVIPPSLWAAMRAAPRIGLESPAAVRTARTVRDYAAIAADSAALDKALTSLPRHIGKATVAEWRALAAAGDVARLAAELIVHHYDPAYRRQGQAGAHPKLAAVAIEALTDDALDRAADAVMAALSGSALQQHVEAHDGRDGDRGGDPGQRQRLPRDSQPTAADDQQGDEAG
jgi:tRNA 2-selenouridine synthase